MSVKSKKEEALQLLDDLDSLSSVPPIPGAPSSTPPTGQGEAADVLKFLDEITQKSSEPTKTTHLERPISRSSTPNLRKSTERIRMGTPSQPFTTRGDIVTPTTVPKTEAESNSVKTSTTASAAGKAWGWGNVWSSASSALQQAKSVVDEQVKNLPNNERAKKWTDGVASYVNREQLEKFSNEFRNAGISTLTDILNVVAPPISEHEVIHVLLSHDMVGYDGVESLTFKSLSRVMQQVEGGDLIVNLDKGSRSKIAESSQRDLNYVEGLELARKLATANVQELVKANEELTTLPADASNPTKISYVYFRIQPFCQPSPISSEQLQLQFLLELSDPLHDLNHSVVSQGIPISWLGLWEQHDWVEDLVVDVLRIGIELVGQEYIVARMGWQSHSTPAVEESKDTQESNN